MTRIYFWISIPSWIQPCRLKHTDHSSLNLSFSGSSCGLHILGHGLASRLAPTRSLLGTLWNSLDVLLLLPLYSVSVRVCSLSRYVPVADSWNSGFVVPALFWLSKLFPVIAGGWEMSDFSELLAVVLGSKMKSFAS